ncbi:cation:proton antiporter [Ferrimonas balearica]|uniref:cation:proton antiporter n=1 Tax=Ferrimonas balearica TaxID=44012 RepID=UPI001C9925C3|nr:sodium:proton antiporter [Ferrimonas balearica]MBY5920472.1 cation:proton antiporter [Ferrimonas balearica]MBY5996843.1 cation:proton antiporter [Ferrimonas balearica]
MSPSPLIALAAIGLLSIFCQWTAFRLKVPAILPLLLAGLLIGPGFGLLQPDPLFGDLLFPIVSLAVAIILFEGSLTLRYADIEGQDRLLLLMITVGMLVTFAIAALAAYWLLGFSSGLSALLGALVVVTGPTVIAPLLRSVRLSPRLATLLHWEGILIDPIGALLAVLVYEYISVRQSLAVEHALLAFGQTILTGILAGALGGFLLAQALKRRFFPHYLEVVAVLTLMLAAFAISNELTHESGLLTVTVMGIWLANTRGLDLDPIIEFKETLSILLISALFLLLAARLTPADIGQIDGPALLWLAVLVLVARPVAVMLCSLGSALSWKERWMVGWVAPRGIVAAAVSSLFALKLAEQNLPGTERLVPLVFLVIIATVVMQSLLTSPMANWLGLKAPPRNGFLIFGANPLARAIAAALSRYEIPVVLSDTNWDSLSQARMQDLPVYYGNPTSEHADATLDLSLVDRLLVLAPYHRLNADVAYHYEDRFGAHKVYRLPEQPRDSSPRRRRAERHQSLFGEEAYFAKLSSMVAQGAQIRATKLTGSFGWDSYQAQQGKMAVPLFAFDPQRKLRVFTAQAPFEPDAGWEILALIPEDKG